MGRYDQWRALQGDTDSPELLDLGKNLLGQLAEQRRLSGNKTGMIVRNLPDGSVVQAYFLGDIPKIRVSKGKRSPPRRKLLVSLMGGLVVQPRSFDDDHAFGAHPEAVLTPKDGAWQNYLFNDSYLVGDAEASGFYEKTKGGTDLFPTGLPSPDFTGWIDWRNADESVAVCWHGHQSRYFPIGSPFEQGREFIYYNGAVLVDTTGACIAEPYEFDRWVMGAALHGSTLLFVVMDKLGFGEMYLRVYKATVEPDYEATPRFRDLVSAGVPKGLAPRFKELTDTEGACELLLTVDMQELNGYANPMFKFNQSANECRAIIHSFNFDDEDDEHLQVREFVIDFRAHLASDEAVTYTDTLLHHLRSRRFHEVVYEEVRANAINGTYTAAVPSGPTTYILDTPLPGLTSGGAIHVLPLKGTSVESVEYLDEEDGGDEWFKLGVDYEDNVPVYVWARPEKLVTNIVFAGHATAQHTSYDMPITFPMQMIASSDMHYDLDHVGARGWGIKAIDKNGVTWLEVTCVDEYAQSLDATSDVDGYNPDGSSLTIGSAYNEQIIHRELTAENIAFYYLDLRYRNAAYTKVTTTGVYDVELTQTGVPISNGWNMDNTLDSTDHGEHHGVTRVLFFGDEVASYTGEFIPADTVNSVTNTTGGFSTYSHMDTMGWFAIRPGTFFVHDDAWMAAIEAGPPYTNFDTPVTYPTYTDERISYPEGAYYWEFNATEANPLGGDWPRFKHLSPGGSVYYGAWGCFKGSWVYSMADLSGSDPSIAAAWVTAMSDGGDADDLTGMHGMESLGQIWPVSTFVHGCVFN